MINVFDNMSLIYLIHYNNIVISVCNVNLLEKIELFDLTIHVLFLFYVS